VSCVHCVKVTVRLTRSSKRMGGVDGHLEQWVGFAGVFVRNEPSSLVVRLYKEMFIRFNREVFLRGLRRAIDFCMGPYLS